MKLEMVGIKYVELVEISNPFYCTQIKVFLHNSYTSPKM